MTVQLEHPQLAEKRNNFIKAYYGENLHKHALLNICDILFASGIMPLVILQLIFVVTEE